MGFFFAEAGVAARKQAAAPRIKVSEAERRLLTCEHCPLNHAPLRHAKMAPTGAERPVFYFMGEAPGDDEDESGTQFVGPAGAFLRVLIPEKYLPHIRWNNTIRCRPTDGKKNREPAYIEISCCTRLQVQDIEKSKPRVIVGFGAVPLHWVMGAANRTISNWRGRKVPVKIGTHVCWYYPMAHPSWVRQVRNEKKRGEAIDRMFQRDLDRMFQEYERGFDEPHVEDPADYLKGIEQVQTYGREGLQIIESALEFFHDKDHALDIETSRLRPYYTDSQILTFAVGTYDRTVAFPYLHPEARWTSSEKKSLHGLLYDYLRGPGRKWAHSAKFEQEWLLHDFGPSVIYDTPWGDTLGQAHIIDEREAKELDELVHLYFGFRLKDQSDVDKKRMAREPLSKVLPYNGMDTKYTEGLSWIQGTILAELGLTATYDFLNSATPSFVHMQAMGVVPNAPVIKSLDKDLSAQEDKIMSKIMGEKDVRAFQTAGNKFEPLSNPDLVHFFRDFLKIPHPGEDRKGGAFAEHSGTHIKDNPKKTTYSVDEQVLAKFDHPVAAAILDLRGIIKNRGYVTPLMPGGKYLHGDGLIHASYSQYIAVSGRSSCKDPNQQNYPRREHKEIRGVVGVPSGYTMVAFDYGQLEWRIGAEISGDATMCREIWEGQDVHGHWTDSIGAKFVPKRLAAGRKIVRDSIKQYWTFANLYGQVLYGLAYDLSLEFKTNITEKDIEPFFIEFWNLYPKLKEYQDSLIDTYNAHGYVENYMGQRRHEPCARNEIINHPFQGSAGHLVINAQDRIARYAYENDRLWLVPRMNIHDDLSFYFPNKTLEQDIETVAGLMCVGTFCTKVPMLVEVSVAENDWAHKDEIVSFTVNRDNQLIEVVK